MQDTHPDFEQMQYKMIMSRTPQERFMMGMEMIESARKLVEYGIRHKNPAISEIELKVEIFKRFYADDFSQEELEKVVRHFKINVPDL